MTSLYRNSIRLTLILGNVGMNKVDNISTDGSLENGRERNCSDNIITRFRKDGNNGTSSLHIKVRDDQNQNE